MNWREFLVPHLTSQLSCCFFFTSCLLSVHPYVVWRTFSKTPLSMCTSKLWCPVTHNDLYSSVSVTDYSRKCAQSYLLQQIPPISVGSMAVQHPSPVTVSLILSSQSVHSCDSPTELLLNSSQQSFLASNAKSPQQCIVVHTAQVWTVWTKM